MRVAILCGVFWPHATVGARRVTAWVRRWADEHGDEVEVLTRRYPRLELQEELATREGLPPKVRVHPLTVEPFTLRRDSSLYRAKVKVANSLLVPDPSIRSWARLSNRVQKLLSDFGPDVVLSTSPPHSVHVVASAAAHALQKPWVADFRDAYLGDSVYGVHGFRRLLARRHVALENALYREAALVVHTHETHDKLQRSRYPEYQNKFIQIPNGVSAEFVEEVGPIERLEGPLRVVVVGSCGRPELGALIEAVAANQELELHYAGLNELPPKSVSGSTLDASRLNHHGMLSERRVAALIGSADVLVIPQDRVRRKQLNSTSRIPEFMASGKPILVANPQNNDELLLKRHYAGSFAIVSSPERRLSWETALRKVRDGDLRSKSIGQVCAIRREFSRETQADRVRNSLVALLR